MVRAVYPLKNPAKSNEKSSGTKQIIFVGGILMTILYFRKNPEQMKVEVIVQ